MSESKGRISMQDIADRLQISKNAVSLALRGKPGVSDETRELVIALAKKLNYNSMGDAPAINAESRNLLVFIPSYIRNDSYFYNDIYWSIDNRASQKGYNAVLATVSDEIQKSKTLPPIANELDFAGFIVIGVLDEDYVRFLLRQQTSLLSVDHLYYGLEVKSIVTANIEGAYHITQKVIGYGHKKIGFVGPYGMTSSIYERWCGFQKAMQDADLAICPEHIINDHSPLSSLLSDPEEVLQRLSGIQNMPTAFVCGGDRIAIATIEALKTLGCKVPQQVSVVGFDDIEISKYVEPKLTTMRVRRKEMGRLAVDYLLQSREGKMSAEMYALKPDYIGRNSLFWAPKRGK